jgi:demethylmenaquinone methyltransferase/2-methoxy-6-polyprenyl-1,4-benzoquinol methylase
VRAPDDLLDEQIAYYRARAPEYDDWWLRRGRYALEGDLRRAWDADVAEVEDAVDDFGPTGAVLELAAGTGIWTERLARVATTITAVDSSPEALARNRARVAGAGADVEHVVADLFAWEPPQRYDVVFFSFWISHVPPGRFDGFWATVDRALAPGGRAYLIDNAPTSEWIDSEGGVSRRELADGRTFDIVKRYWSADDLAARLRPLGWVADLQQTERFFLHGSVVRG